MGLHMKIEIEITAQQIANLFISAIESGDPVTTASKGGWCSGIYHQSRETDPPAGTDTGKGFGTPWYADPQYYEKPFVIEVIEVDTDTNDETRHKITLETMSAGLAKMVKEFPDAFADLMRDDSDAPCADAFLQAVLFGEEKYA